MEDWETLYNKYPVLFENRHKTPMESCMSFGVGCNLGWYNIISNVCFEIDQHEKNVTNEKGFAYNKDYQKVKFDQIKEKFGGLRIYYSGGDEYIRGVIHMAESMSYFVCEDCGNKGKPNKGGWISTLCDGCRTKNDSDLLH